MFFIRNEHLIKRAEFGILPTVCSSLPAIKSLPVCYQLRLGVLCKISVSRTTWCIRSKYSLNWNILKIFRNIIIIYSIINIIYIKYSIIVSSVFDKKLNIKWYLSVNLLYLIPEVKNQEIRYYLLCLMSSTENIPIVSIIKCLWSQYTINCTKLI